MIEFKILAGKRQPGAINDYSVAKNTASIVPGSGLVRNTSADINSGRTAIGVKLATVSAGATARGCMALSLNECINETIAANILDIESYTQRQAMDAVYTNTDNDIIIQGWNNKGRISVADTAGGTLRNLDADDGLHMGSVGEPISMTSTGWAAALTAGAYVLGLIDAIYAHYFDASTNVYELSIIDLNGSEGHVSE